MNGSRATYAFLCRALQNGVAQRVAVTCAAIHYSRNTLSPAATNNPNKHSTSSISSLSLFFAHLSSQKHASAALVRALRDAKTARELRAVAEAEGVSLESGVDSVTDDFGRSLLVLATLRGCSMDVFEYLLSNTRDPNIRDPKSNLSLLSLLIMHGSEQQLRALLDHPQFSLDKAFNEADYYGLTPLHKAIAFKRPAMVRRLVQQAKIDVDAPTVAANDVRGAGWERQPVGETGLHFASRNGDARMVALLLSLGANPNASCASTGDTPLHVACRRNNKVTPVKASENVSVERVSADNNRNNDVATATPTTTTSSSSSSSSSSSLSSSSSSSTAITSGTAAQATALPRTSNYEVVQLLLAANANLGAKNNNGETPLDVAPTALRLIVQGGLLDRVLSAQFAWQKFRNQSS